MAHGLTSSLPEVDFNNATDLLIKSAMLKIAGVVIGETFSLEKLGQSQE